MKEEGNSMEEMGWDRKEKVKRGSWAGMRWVGITRNGKERDGIGREFYRWDQKE